MNDDTSTKDEENSNNDGVAKEHEAVKENHGRRIQDGIRSRTPTRKMNLDRRYENSERRFRKAASYRGKARRYTIDRRLTNKDRRKPD